MVYDPANVAKGFLGGVAAGQQQQARGLDIEKMRKEMRSKEAQERKREQISGLVSGHLGGDVSARAGLLNLGTQGLEALSKADKYTQEQQTAATEQLEKNANIMMGITDQGEWEAAMKWARPLLVASGVEPGAADIFMNMPMEKGQEVIKRVLGETTKTPTGDFQVYQKPDGTTENVNEATAEGQKKLAANPDWVKAPSRRETGAPGAFASGGKAEQKDLNVLATSTNTLLRNLDNAVKTLKVEPASGQIIGDIAVFADNMAENLKTIAGNSGVIEADMRSDIEAFSGAVEPIAAATSKFNALLIDAAYAKALIQNGTRPTNADFNNAYKSLTGGSQNPKILIRNLKRAAGDLEKDFRFRYRESTGKDWGGKFDYSAKGGKEPALDRDAPTGPQADSAPEGTIAKRGGVSWEKRGGTWRKM